MPTASFRSATSKRSPLSPRTHGRRLGRRRKPPSVFVALLLVVSLCFVVLFSMFVFLLISFSFERSLLLSRRRGCPAVSGAAPRAGRRPWDHGRRAGGRGSPARDFRSRRPRPTGTSSPPRVRSGTRGRRRSLSIPAPLKQNNYVLKILMRLTNNLELLRCEILTQT